MKLLILVLLTAFTSLYAAGPSISGELTGEYIVGPATDDNLDSYTFSVSELYETAYANFDAYITADDIHLAMDATIDEIAFFMLSTSSMPTSVDVYFYTDTGTGPGSEITSTSASVSTTAVGYQFAGYEIYETLCTLASGFSVIGGETYWIGPNRPGSDTLYSLVGITVRGQESYLSQDTGATWVTWSSQGYAPTDMFRVVYGTPETALERGTWGNIKSTF